MKSWFVAVFALLLFVTGCGVNEVQGHHKPIAVDGALNLTTWDLASDGSVSLSGQWKFYWHQLVSAQDVGLSATTQRFSYAKMPHVWTGMHLNGSVLPANGYATYALALTLNSADAKRTLALYIPIINTAYQAWIDGQLVASVGTVGTEKNAMIPGYNPSVVYFTPHSAHVQIVIQVSNYMQRIGGMWKPLVFGTADNVTRSRDLAWAEQLALIGALLVMGLYHLGLFFARRKDVSMLWFGLLCIDISVRAMFVGTMVMMKLIPSIPFGLELRIEYLTFAIALPLFVMLFHTLYANESLRWVDRLSRVMSGLFAAFVIFSGPQVFTQLLIYFESYSLLITLYVLVLILRALRHRQENAAVTVITSVFLAATIINDYLYYNQMIPGTDLVSLGLFVFLFGQAIGLSKKFSRAFQDVEKMSEQLQHMNANLELMVAQRTIELERSQAELMEVNRSLEELSYVDELTKIGNRRFFNDTLLREWGRAIRNQTPLSLLMIDIDFFKEYNDMYGHFAGDECIRQVATAMRTKLKRSHDFVARYGGEEFAVILPETDVEGAGAVARALRQKIADLKIPHENSPISFELTLSMGVTSIIPDRTQDPMQTLFNQADRALYCAKEEGRNRIAFYSAE